MTHAEARDVLWSEGLAEVWVVPGTVAGVRFEFHLRHEGIKARLYREGESEEAWPADTAEKIRDLDVVAWHPLPERRKA